MNSIMLWRKMKFAAVSPMVRMSRATMPPKLEGWGAEQAEATPPMFICLGSLITHHKTAAQMSRATSQPMMTVSGWMCRANPSVCVAPLQTLPSSHSVRPE